MGRAALALALGAAGDVDGRRSRRCAPVRAAGRRRVPARGQPRARRPAPVGRRARARRSRGCAVEAARPTAGARPTSPSARCRALAAAQRHAGDARGGGGHAPRAARSSPRERGMPAVLADCLRRAGAPGATTPDRHHEALAIRVRARAAARASSAASRRWRRTRRERAGRAAARRGRGGARADGARAGAERRTTPRPSWRSRRPPPTPAARAARARRPEPRLGQPDARRARGRPARRRRPVEPGDRRRGCT